MKNICLVFTALFLSACIGGKTGNGEAVSTRLPGSDRGTGVSESEIKIPPPLDSELSDVEMHESRQLLIHELDNK